jgi:hypothetical protein
MHRTQALVGVQAPKIARSLKERAYVEVLLAFTTILQQLGIALKGSMKSGIEK